MASGYEEETYIVLHTLPTSPRSLLLNERIRSCGVTHVKCCFLCYSDMIDIGGDADCTTEPLPVASSDSDIQPEPEGPLA